VEWTGTARFKKPLTDSTGAKREWNCQENILDKSNKTFSFIENFY